jgi:hypothetical protein
MYSAPPNGTCTMCPPGKFGSTTGLTACTNCVPGYASAVYAAVACTACVVGTYSDVAGQVACISCMAGAFSNVFASTACNLCVVGTYQDTSGQSTCMSCGAGSYASSIGVTTCTLCAVGTYQAVIGASACTPCAAGSYAATIGSSVCTLCSVDSYAANAGQSVCSLCASGTFAPSTGATACTPASPTSSPGPTPNPTSPPMASYVDNGNAISLSFSSSLTAGLADCSDLLTQQSLSQLGSRPSCSWGLTTVLITLDYDATLPVAGVLQLLRPSRLDVVATAPQNPVPPIAVLGGRTSAGGCSDLVVTADTSYGNGGRPLTFSWTVAVPPGPPSWYAPVAALINGQQGSSLYVNSSSLAVAGSSFNLTVMVRVDNWLGLYAVASRDISVTNSATLFAELVGLSVRTQNNNAPTLIVTQTSQCIGGVLTRSAAGVTFSWQQVSGPSTGATSSTSQLALPSFTLLGGTSYVFAMTATLGAVQSQVTVTVQGVLPSVVPVLTGANSLFGLVGAPLFLNSCNSTDPSIAPGRQPALLFQWTCARQASPAPCFQPDLLLGVGTCSVSIPVSAFDIPDNYVFTVTIWRNSTNSSSGVSVSGTVQAVSSAALAVTISSQAQLTQFNPSTRLNLVGAVGSALVSSYVWTCVSGNLNLAASNTGSPANSSILVVTANTLSGGQVYRFRLTATDKFGATGWGEAIVTVSSPPSGGSCVAEATTVESTYQLTCTGWTANNLPLTYAFQQMQNSLAVSLSNSQPSPQAQVLLPSGNLTLQAIISDTLGVSTTVSFTVTVPLSVAQQGLRSVADAAQYVSQAIPTLQIAVTAGDTDYTNQLINNYVNVLDTQRQTDGITPNQTVLDALQDAREQMFTALTSTSNANGDITPTVATLLSQPDEVSDQLAVNAISYVQNLLGSSSSSTTPISPSTSPATILTVAQQAILSVTPNTTAAADVGDAFAALIPLVTASVLSSTVAGSDAIHVDTPYISLVVQRASPSESTFSSTATSSGLGFFLPSDIWNCTQSVPPVVDSSFTLMKLNPSNVDNPFSQVAALSFTVAGNSSQSVPINCQQANPPNITIVLPLDPSRNKSKDNELTCQFFDTVNQQWASDGCSLVSVDSTLDRAVCACFHLTDFAMFARPGGAAGTTSSKLSTGTIIMIVILCVVGPIVIFAVLACLYVQYGRQHTQKISLGEINGEVMLTPEKTKTIELVHHDRADDLPEGWEKISTEDGEPYYWHAATETSVWDREEIPTALKK